MCGIVGVMTKRKNGLFNTDLEIFSDMLFADQLRGSHGTGIFWDELGDSKYLKGAMPSSAFLRSKEYPDVAKDIIRLGNFVIGHNRHATKGEINFNNTHPFQEGDIHRRQITLIHNGTLHSHRHMKNVDVDSHAICHSIQEIGHIDTLKKLDGAFALVWHDNETGLLHFIHNTERPLHIAETDNLFIIASEGGLIDWIVDRRNAFRKVKTASVEVGHLYTYNPKTQSLTNEKVEIKPKYSYTHYGQGSFRGDIDYWDSYPKEPSSTPVTQLPYKPSTKRYHDPKLQMLDVRVGDDVIFSPVDCVEMEGKKMSMLTGLVDTLIYGDVKYLVDSKTFVETKYYYQDHERLNQMLEYSECKGTISQIVYRGGVKAVILRDVAPIIRVATQKTKEEDDVPLETVAS